MSYAYAEKNLPFVVRSLFDIPISEGFHEEVAKEIVQYPHWLSLLSFVQSSEYQNNPMHLSLFPHNAISLPYQIGAPGDFQITMWLLEYAKKHYAEDMMHINRYEVAQGLSKKLQEYLMEVPKILPAKHLVILQFPDQDDSLADHNGAFKNVPDNLRKTFA